MDKNKDLKEIKNELDIDQVADLVAELGGEPQQKGNILICKTICHQGESHKLYYYNNTKLFRCYTECDDVFDIYELILKVKHSQGEEWSLSKAIYYVAQYFGYDIIYQDNEETISRLFDWDIFKKYNSNLLNMSYQQIDENTFHIYDNILEFFPQPHILAWEEEGISFQTMKEFGIKYNPITHGVLIPHYDKDFNLIGIRERTLKKENEKYGKYRPAIIGETMYNHPLGFNLYGLEHAKKAIEKTKTAIVMEGEKSVLKYCSYFGVDNNIAVACCGNSFTNHHFKLLQQYGVQELIIGFDKQFKEIGDTEFKNWVKKLYKIHQKYNSYVKVSFLFDSHNQLLNYKDSPIDQGKEVFLRMYKERIFL